MKTIGAILLFLSGIFGPTTAQNLEKADDHRVEKAFETNRKTDKFSEEWISHERLDAPKQIKFAHGDVSWLPSLAKQAGWPDHTIGKLSELVLRESGGCPNRRGGDKVDKDCNITGVSEWNHRSDTGLLQINGVNYDLSRNKWAAICRQINICTQEPLLEPLTNLKAGLVLYNLSGFEPWNPCNWRVCKAATTTTAP